MRKTDTMLRKELRESMIEEISAVLVDTFGYTIMRVKGNKIAIGCVDSEGNDRWAEMTIAIPTGSHDGDEVYDGEALAKDYAEHQEEVKAKAEERERKRKADAEARKAKAEEKKRLKEGQ